MSSIIKILSIFENPQPPAPLSLLTSLLKQADQLVPFLCAACHKNYIKKV